MRLQSPSSEHNVTPFSRGTQHAGRADTQLYTLASSVYLPGKDRGIIPLVELHICRTKQALADEPWRTWYCSPSFASIQSTFTSACACIIIIRMTTIYIWRNPAIYHITILIPIVNTSSVPKKK